MKSFSELTLAPALHKALQGMKFTTPTPIQAQSIPVALTGRDLIACAQTGTGKTVAFGLPILSALIEKKDKTALILVPTRELALQVDEVFKQLTAFLPAIKIVNLIGGVSMQPQLRSLQRGYRVLIATPGRLCDHLDRGSVKLDRVEVLTLDEADRMLDMGFAPQLREVFSYLPKQHQTLLFSATLPQNIKELTQNILENPAEVKVAATPQAAPKIDQQTKSVNGEEKNKTIVEEINAREGSILIFARTQKRTDRLTYFLERFNINASRIHGGRSQGQRNRALEDFRDGTVRVMVATDIAARGIDIDHVAHVINYDLPQVPEDYVHRIGRTARAGREGKALSLISHEERNLWRDIEKLLAGKGTSAQREAQFKVAPAKSESPKESNPKKFDSRAPQGKKPSFGNKPSFGSKPNFGAKRSDDKKAPQGKRPFPSRDSVGPSAMKRPIFGPKKTVTVTA